MLKKCFSIFLLVLVSLCFGCSHAGTGKPANQPDSAFSSQPEMDEYTWEELKSMDTNTLLQQIMRSPWLGELFAFSSLQQGFLHIRQKVPAVEELMSRTDNAEILLEAYQEAEPPPDTAESESYTFSTFYSVSILGIFLAQPEVREHCTPQMRQRWEAVVADKREALRHSAISQNTYDEVVRELQTSNN